MASSLLDWVAKVFSSRGLQVTLQFTPVNRLGHNEDISGWGTCPLGLRGGLGAGGVRACEICHLVFRSSEGKVWNFI